MLRVGDAEKIVDFFECRRKIKIFWGMQNFVLQG